MEATTEAWRNYGTAYLQHGELQENGKRDCKRELQRLEPRRHGDTENGEKLWELLDASGSERGT